MNIPALIRVQYEHLSSSQKRVIGLLIIILVFILIIVGCKTLVHKKIPVEPLMIRRRGQIIIPEKSPLREQIVLQSVHTSSCPHKLSFPGIIEADPARTINVLPPLTGRLIKLSVKLGETVKKNQLLAVIKSPDLAQASADFDKAKNMRDYAHEALLRAEKSYHVGATPLKELHLIHSNYIQANADFLQTRARLKTLGNNQYSQLQIKAPISGQIIALNYGKGAYINDTNVPLFTISNIKSVLVIAFIPEHLIGAVTQGQNADILTLAYPDEVLHGHVGFVNSMIESDTRRNKTRIALKNPLNKLQPNMYATINIAIKQPNQILVPISAVLMNNDTTSVYVETAPWTFTRREVQLGNEENEHVHIQSGLHVGEKIVASGGVFIND